MFFASQAALPLMLATGQGGVIVNISSQMGHVGAEQRTVYCTTKHAVEGFTKALAVEPRATRCACGVDRSDVRTHRDDRRTVGRPRHRCATTPADTNRSFRDPRRGRHAGRVRRLGRRPDADRDKPRHRRRLDGEVIAAHRVDNGRAGSAAGSTRMREHHRAARKHSGRAVRGKCALRFCSLMPSCGAPVDPLWSEGGSSVGQVH